MFFTDAMLNDKHLCIAFGHWDNFNIHKFCLGKIPKSCIFTLIVHECLIKFKSLMSTLFISFKGSM